MVTVVVLLSWPEEKEGVKVKVVVVTVGDWEDWN